MNVTISHRRSVLWCRRAVVALVAALIAALSPAGGAFADTAGLDAEVEVVAHAGRRSAAAPQPDTDAVRLTSSGGICPDDRADDVSQPAVEHRSWPLHESEQLGPPGTRGPPLRR